MYTGQEFQFTMEFIKGIRGKDKGLLRLFEWICVKISIYNLDLFIEHVTKAKKNKFTATVTSIIHGAVL